MLTMQIKKAITVDFEKMSYFPPIFFNDFWLLKDYMIPMNETVTQIPLYFTVSGLSGLKYMLYNQAEQSFNMQALLLYGIRVLESPELSCKMLLTKPLLLWGLLQSLNATHELSKL